MNLYFFFLSMFLSLKANSVDPDEMPLYQGLRGLSNISVSSPQ